MKITQILMNFALSYWKKYMFHLKLDLENLTWNPNTYKHSKSGVKFNLNISFISKHNQNDFLLFSEQKNKLYSNKGETIKSAWQISCIQSVSDGSEIFI